MEEIAGFRVGEVEVTRVPYFDVALDPALVNLTTEQVRAIDWSLPSWATADGQLMVGVAVWVIVSKEQLIVVDPCGAADTFIRSGPEAIGHQEAVLAGLREAGFPPERVDVVVLSHLDGIGMAALVAPDGSWAPAFPNARIVMSTAELEYLAGGAAAQGLEALNALIAQGVVDGVADGHAITDEVHLEVTGGHSPGHAFVHVESDGQEAVFVGHLALNPLAVAPGEVSGLHVDAPTAQRRLAALRAGGAGGETLLIGPLWPFPGAGYLAGDDGRILAAD